MKVPALSVDFGRAGSQDSSCPGKRPCVLDLAFAPLDPGFPSWAQESVTAAGCEREVRKSVGRGRETSRSSRAEAAGAQ